MMPPLNENIPDNVRKYLEKYSFGNYCPEYTSTGYFNNIVVIPALREYENIKNLLNSLSQCERQYFSETLFLFVINNTVSASDEINAENYETINYMRRIINGETFDEISESVINSGLILGIIDASQWGLELPDKEGGVGLARKIGMDAALSLFDYKNGRKKIIICLDADCIVQANYLRCIVNDYNSGKYNAAYVKFEHPIPEEKEGRQAIICYEIFLRYYVLGLIYAGSAYSIHTIGSTMICDYESYIKVEGMNKKKAAEDFYFMEKLCKNYDVHTIEGTKVFPSSRGSWRVPFGTGQRVNRHLAKTQNEYLLYSPESFDVLKKWLIVFNAGRLTGKEYLDEARKISDALYNFLIENKFEESWHKILDNCKNNAQLSKQKHFWFDGFRTLKLIHYLRDNGYPLWDMNKAAETLFAKIGHGTKIKLSGNFINDEIEQLACLEKLRELA